MSQKMQPAVVLVIAPAKSGKTTIAAKLSQRLKISGANVTVVDDASQETIDKLCDIGMSAQDVKVRTCPVARSMGPGDRLTPPRERLREWAKVNEHEDAYTYHTENMELTVEEVSEGEFETCGTFDGCGHTLRATTLEDAKKEALVDLETYLTTVLYEILT